MRFRKRQAILALASSVRPDPAESARLMAESRGMDPDELLAWCTSDASEAVQASRARFVAECVVLDDEMELGYASETKRDP